MFEDVVTLKVPLPNAAAAQIPFSPISIEISEPEEVQLPVTIDVQPLYVDIFNSPDFVKVKQGDALKYQWVQSDTKLPAFVTDGNVYLNYELKSNTTLPAIKTHTEFIFDNHREFEGSSVLSNRWNVNANVNIPIGIATEITTPAFVVDALGAIPTDVTADVKTPTFKLDADVIVSRALVGETSMAKFKSDGQINVPSAIVEGPRMQTFTIANKDNIAENEDNDKPKTEYEILIARNLTGDVVIPNRFKSDGYVKLDRIIDYDVKMPTFVTDSYIKVPIVIDHNTTMPAFVSEGLVGIPTQVYGENKLSNQWDVKGNVDYVKRFEGHSHLPAFNVKGLVGLPVKVDWQISMPPFVASGELKLVDYVNANIEMPKFTTDALLSDSASGSLTNIVIGDGETLIIGNGFKIKEM